MWGASRKGTLDWRTGQSSRSVAVAKPLSANARILSVRKVTFSTMPVIAAMERPSRSCASNTGGLSSRSEEHTSELQSLMRISYAVFCLKKKKTKKIDIMNHRIQKKLQIENIL